MISCTLNRTCGLKEEVHVTLKPVMVKNITDLMIRGIDTNRRAGGNKLISHEFTAKNSLDLRVRYPDA